VVGQLALTALQRTFFGAIEPITTCLESLFHRIWQSGRVPVDWRSRVIIPLYKGKGFKTDCSSYRPVSLFSMLGKVFARVLLGCLKPLCMFIAAFISLLGFTPGRSALDAIVALRHLFELNREFQRPLHAAYVHLKFAFDSIDRSALWLAL